MIGLRIGWAAPWDEDSLIARSAAQVAFELSRSGHSVTVLRTEVGQALHRPPRLAPEAVHALTMVSALELRQNFDVLVAHIGDSFESHGAILPWLSEIGFVGIFHDSCVENLMSGWGETGAAAIAGRSGQPDDEGTSSRGALGWLAGQMVGAIAHTEGCARRLRVACPAPVGMIPLAFMIPDLPPPPSAWSHMIIGVLGWITRSDRIDQLILAIAASPILRQRCRIKVIGGAPEDERARVEVLARRLHVDPPKFIAHVADDELGWQLRDVDVVACFNPTFGPGSALWVLAQISGRPVLVAGHDRQCGVPADNMLVCSVRHVARDVVRHLERLLENPKRSARMSDDSRESAFRRHSPTVYSRSLLPFLENVVLRQPERRARRNLVGTLRGFGLAPNDPAAIRVQAVLADLVTNGKSVYDDPIDARIRT